MTIFKDFDLKKVAEAPTTFYNYSIGPDKPATYQVLSTVLRTHVIGEFGSSRTIKNEQ